MTAADAGRKLQGQIAEIVWAGMSDQPWRSEADEIAEALLPVIAAERARAVADLRAAVEAVADELEREAAEVIGRHTPAQVALAAHILVQERAVAEAKPWIADRLRAVLDATSEQQP